MTRDRGSRHTEMRRTTSTAGLYHALFLTYTIPYLTTQVLITKQIGNDVVPCFSTTLPGSIRAIVSPPSSLRTVMPWTVSHIQSQCQYKYIIPVNKLWVLSLSSQLLRSSFLPQFLASCFWANIRVTF